MHATTKNKRDVSFLKGATKRPFYQTKMRYDLSWLHFPSIPSRFCWRVYISLINRPVSIFHSSGPWSSTFCGRYVWLLTCKYSVGRIDENVSELVFLLTIDFHLRRSHVDTYASMTLMYKWNVLSFCLESKVYFKSYFRTVTWKLCIEILFFFRRETSTRLSIQSATSNRAERPNKIENAFCGDPNATQGPENIHRNGGFPGP